MNMNKKAFVPFLLLSALLMSSCSSDEPVPEQAKIAIADDSSFDVPAGTPTKASDALGDGVVGTDEQDLDAIKAVNKGLEIALPSLESYDVQRNETVRLTAPGEDPKAMFDAFIYYYDKGNESATLNLGEFKAGEKGDVLAEVVIPKNIEPGKYVIALDAGNGIYTSSIEVK